MLSPRAHKCGSTDEACTDIRYHMQLCLSAVVLDECENTQCTYSTRQYANASEMSNNTKVWQICSYDSREFLLSRTTQEQLPVGSLWMRRTFNATHFASEVFSSCERRNSILFESYAGKLWLRWAHFTLTWKTVVLNTIDFSVPCLCVYWYSLRISARRNHTPPCWGAQFFVQITDSPLLPKRIHAYYLPSIYLIGHRCKSFGNFIINLKTTTKFKRY